MYVETTITYVCIFIENIGIGLLSKHKIKSHNIKHLTYHSGPDKNKRVILHAVIETGGAAVNVIVVHLSYEKTQQCGNAEEILQYIKGTRKKKKSVSFDQTKVNSLICLFAILKLIA